MKAFRSTLLLLAVAAVVGGYIYFNERGPVADENSTVLLRADAGSRNQIGMHASSGTPLSLQKIHDAWNVKREGKTVLSVPADADAVKSLLENVQLLQSDTVVPAGKAKLVEYGLDKPKGSLSVAGTTVEFGNKPSFDQTRVYAKVGDRIALLPPSLSDAAAKPFAEWRDKSILRVSPDDVSTVQIQAPAVAATFTKTKDESKPADAATDANSASGTSGTNIWNLTRPVGASGEASVLDAFLSQLPTTKTTEFLDDNPTNKAKWGLDRPLARIVVTDAQGVRTLLVCKKLPPAKTTPAAKPGEPASSTGGGYAAQNSLSPAIFRLSDTTFGLLNRPLRDRRAKTVLAVEPAAVASLKIATRGSVRNYTGNSGKWSHAGGPGGPTGDALNQGVIDLLLTVQSLRAQDFIDKPGPDATYGFDRPMLQLDMTSSGWSGTKVLQIGGKVGRVYARVGSEGSFGPPVYVLPATATGDFKGKLDVLFPTAGKGGKP